MNVRVRLAAAVFAAVSWALAAPVMSQEYPNRPVRIVVPFAPGGSAGAQARTLAPGPGKGRQHPIVVEYKPGAGTTIGAAHVARSDPDGYTLYFAGTSHTISASLYKNLPYDPVKSFAPVSLVAIAALMLVVSPDSGIDSLKELIAQARSRPGQLTYSSSGAGGSPHLAGEQFRMLSDIKVIHVPFQGSSPALAALIGRHVDFSMQDVSALSNIKAGKVKVLAVTTARRSSMLPDTPTMMESGFEYSTPAWGGILAPAGTPAAIVQRLNAAIARTLQDPEVVEQFRVQGFDVIGGSAEEFQRFLTAEVQSYAKVVAEAGVKTN